MNTHVLVMSRACLGDVLVMCGDCVVMFWWYVGDALVLCGWCLCSVSVMLWWCLSDVWWCRCDVLVMALWYLGDEHWWTFSDFQWVPKRKECLFDVSLLLGRMLGYFFLFERYNFAPFGTWAVYSIQVFTSETWAVYAVYFWNYIEPYALCILLNFELRTPFAFWSPGEVWAVYTFLLLKFELYNFAKW